MVAQEKNVNNSGMTSLNNRQSVLTAVGGDAEMIPTNTVGSSSLKPRKAVSFDEQRNRYIHSMYEDKADCYDLWYHKTDMTRFKAMNQQLADEILHCSNSRVSMFWRRVLERTYEKVKEKALESLREGGLGGEGAKECLLESVLHPCERKNLQELYSFNMLCPLGIERMIVNMLASDAAYRRREQLDRIYDIEEQIGTQNLGSELQSELIRFACESLSLGACLFSKEIAMAFAAAQGQHQ